MLLEQSGGPRLAPEDFAACSGARTNALYQTNSDNPEEPAQFLRLDEARYGDIGLVTMSMGGNDAGFGDIIRDCVTRLSLAGTVAAALEAKTALAIVGVLHHGECQDAQNAGFNTGLGQLDGTNPNNSAAGPQCGMDCDATKKCPPQSTQDANPLACNPYNLIQLYETLRVRAPYARILVLGYPRQFPPGQGDPSQRDPCQHIDGADLEWANKTVTDKLNATIEKNIVAANANGAGVEFVPTVDKFLPHPQECGTPIPGGTAFNGVLPELAREGDIAGWFHPNKLGHQLLADAVLEKLKLPSSFTAPARPDPTRPCPPTPCTVITPDGGIRITISRVYQYSRGTQQLPPLPGGPISNRGTSLHIHLDVTGRNAVNLDLINDFDLVSSTGDTSSSNFNEGQFNAGCPGGGAQSTAILGSHGSFDGPLCFNAQRGEPATALRVKIGTNDLLVPLK